MEKPIILIIDDNKAVLDSYSKLFSEDFQVTTCETLPDAKEMLIKDIYDIAIIDMSFPDKPKGGLSLCKFISDKKIKTKSIILTAFGTLDNYRKANNLGVSDYIEKGKPDTNEKLTESLSKTLDITFNKIDIAKKEIAEEILSIKVNTEINISDAYHISLGTLKDYITLDKNLSKNITELCLSIENYFKNTANNVRPLNYILHGHPGSGKSYLVKCLINKLYTHKVSAINFNMASYENAEDFLPPLEEIRNIQISNQYPLFFIDEFDNNSKNYPLFLPLMWDGEINIGHRYLKLGKIVIILAGSKNTLSEAIETAKNMGNEIKSKSTDLAKEVDLLSRINGKIIQLPILNKEEKICVFLFLLKNKYKHLKFCDLNLLKFVGENNFRYGIRSIYNFVNYIKIRKGIAIGNELNINHTELPFKNVVDLKSTGLIYHFLEHEKEGGADSVIKLWKRINEENQNNLVRFA